MESSEDNGEAIGFSHGSFGQLGLTDFPQSEEISSYFSLDFSGNSISSFANLPILPLLEDLIMDDTKIESFYGVKRQPSLNSISLKNTPISNYPGLRIMTIVAFGYWLKEIDGVKVTKEETSEAQKLGPRLRPLLESGWVLTSVDVPRIIHFRTRKCGLLDEISENEENSKIDISTLPESSLSASTEQKETPKDSFSITSKAGVVIEGKSKEEKKYIVMKEPNIAVIKKSGKVKGNEKKRTEQTSDSESYREINAFQSEASKNDKKSHHKHHRSSRSEKTESDLFSATILNDSSTIDSEERMVSNTSSSYIEINSFASSSMKPTKENAGNAIDGSSFIINSVLEDSDTEQKPQSSSSSKQQSSSINTSDLKSLSSSSHEKRKKKGLVLQNFSETNICKVDSSSSAPQPTFINLRLSPIISLHAPLLEKDQKRKKPVLTITENVDCSYDKLSFASSRDSSSHVEQAGSVSIGVIEPNQPVVQVDQLTCSVVESANSSFLGRVEIDGTSNIPLAALKTDSQISSSDSVPFNELRSNDNFFANKKKMIEEESSSSSEEESSSQELTLTKGISIKAPALPVPNIEPILEEAKKKAEQLVNSNSSESLKNSSDVKSVESIPVTADVIKRIQTTAPPSQLSPTGTSDTHLTSTNSKSSSNSPKAKQTATPEKSLNNIPDFPSESSSSKRIAKPPPLPVPNPNLEKAEAEVKKRSSRGNTPTKSNQSQPSSEHHHHHHHHKHHSTSSEAKTLDSISESEHRHSHRSSRHETPTKEKVSTSKSHRNPPLKDEEKTLEEATQELVKPLRRRVRKAPVTLDPDDISLGMLSDSIPKEKRAKAVSPKASSTIKTTSILKKTKEPENKYKSAKVDFNSPLFSMDENDVSLSYTSESSSIFSNGATGEKRKSLYQPRKRKLQKSFHPDVAMTVDPMDVSPRRAVKPKVQPVFSKLSIDEEKDSDDIVIPEPRPKRRTIVRRSTSDQLPTIVNQEPSSSSKSKKSRDSKNLNSLRITF